MGYRHDPEQLLAAIVEACLDDGLPVLTFGRLASRLGVSDRILVYYFESKEALLGAVMANIGARLQADLEAAFGSSPRPPAELVDSAWKVLGSPKARPIFAIWFELIGRAVRGEQPHATLAQATAAAWIDWIAERVDAPTAATRRRIATRVLATIEGALLLRLLGQSVPASLVIEQTEARR